MPTVRRPASRRAAAWIVGLALVALVPTGCDLYDQSLPDKTDAGPDMQLDAEVDGGADAGVDGGADADPDGEST